MVTQGGGGQRLGAGRGMRKSREVWAWLRRRRSGESGITCRAQSESGTSCRDMVSCRAQGESGAGRLLWGGEAHGPWGHRGTEASGALMTAGGVGRRATSAVSRGRALGEEDGRESSSLESRPSQARARTTVEGAGASRHMSWRGWQVVVRRPRPGIRVRRACRVGWETEGGRAKL